MPASCNSCLLNCSPASQLNLKIVAHLTCLRRQAKPVRLHAMEAIRGPYTGFCSSAPADWSSD